MSHISTSLSKDAKWQLTHTKKNTILVAIWQPIFNENLRFSLLFDKKLRFKSQTATASPVSITEKTTNDIRTGCRMATIHTD